MAKKKVLKKKSGKKAAKKKSTKKKAPKVKLGKQVVENSGKISKLVAAVDSKKAAVKDAEAAVQTAFQALLDALQEQGGSSFVHDELGPVTIMTRNGQMFWRPKPVGRNAA